MATKTNTELRSYADTYIDTNGVNDITGAELNDMLNDMIDSFQNVNEDYDVDSIIYATGAGVSVAQGEVAWNSDEDTLDIGQQNGVVLQVGSELNPLFRNATGATISDGTPVMFSGTVGASGRITIQKAIADGSIPQSYAIGITTEEIANGADGHVTWFGKVRGLNTTGSPYGETWANGDILYISSTNAGYLTNVKPDAPNYQIEVAAVIYAHATVGSIFVRPTWTPKMTDLVDVDGGTLEHGSVYVWDDDLGVFNPITLNTFGELHCATNAFVLSSSVYTLIDNMTDGISNNVLTDGANGEFTIQSDGVYKLDTFFSFTFSVSNTTIHICLFKNGVEELQSEMERKIGTGGDVGNAGSTCLFAASSGDVITMRVKASGAGTFTISHSNINISKLGTYTPPP